MKLIFGSTWLLLFAVCFLTLGTEAINYSQPILPETYSGLIAQGFATNFFKTDPVLKKYKGQNIDDVYNAGFRNLRLRCRADLFDYPYNSTEFESFLGDMEGVVDKCLTVGVTPIISWIHHAAEAYATEEDLENYIIWWTKVADKLKYKDYRLGFNLFTELGIDHCQHTGNCSESLKLHPTKYNTWTSQVVDAIRNVTGNNKERMLILGSPRKMANGLHLINSSIYANDSYMMAEHHVYAAGPTNKTTSPRYWEGNGTTEQRQTLLDELQTAKDNIPLKTYFGAWMPQDNKEGSLDQNECDIFAEYFVSVLKNQSIPWSLNVLDVYYETKKTRWRNETQDIQGASLNMSRVLDVIKEHM